MGVTCEAKRALLSAKSDTVGIKWYELYLFDPIEPLNSMVKSVHCNTRVVDLTVRIFP